MGTAGSGGRPRRFSWQKIGQWTKASLAILAAVPTLVVGVWIILSVLVLTFHHHSVDLYAIGVPEALSKAGFTSDVATQQLRAAILDIQGLSRTTMRKTAIDTDQDLSAISIPKTGLSVQGIAATLRDALPSWRHEIAGEFTQSGTKLSFKLRLNGKTIFSSTATNDVDGANTLIGDGLQGGAFEIVRATQPYYAAAALYGGGRGDLRAADDILDDVIAHFPLDSEETMNAFVLKGAIAEKAGDYPAALAYYKRAPRLAISYICIGNLYYNRKVEGRGLDDALNQYRIALREDTSLSLVHVSIGNVYYEKHNPDAALTEYQVAVRLDPTSTASHIGLGNVYHDRREVDAAMTEYRIAMKLDPTSSGPHDGLGNVYYDLYKFDAAIAEYEIAIKLNPDSSDPHNGLGNVYRDLHKQDSAIAEFQIAIKLDPNSAGPYNGLGNVYSDHNKPDAALIEYQTAIKLDPEYAMAYNNLGAIYYVQHKLDAAITECQTSIKLDPTLWRPHNILGAVYDDQQKSGAAIAEYQIAIKLDPTISVPHNGLGVVYRHQHKLDLAIAELNAAIKLDPNSSEPYFNLGQSFRDVAASAGESPQKIVWLKRACNAFVAGGKLAPDDPDYPARAHDVDAAMAGQGRCPAT